MSEPVYDPEVPATAIEPSNVFSAQRMITLAETLEAGQATMDFVDQNFRVAVAESAAALRFVATYVDPRECRMDLPYERMYEVRRADGKVWWTCDHSPAHETEA